MLSWDDSDALDAAAPSPTAWLQEWDLHAEGLAALILAAAPGQQQHQPQQAVHSPHAEQQKAQGQQQAEQHAPAPGTAEVPKQEATQQEGQQGQLEQQKAAAAQAHQQHQPVLDSAAAVAADLERLRGVMLQHAGRPQTTPAPSLTIARLTALSSCCYMPTVVLDVCCTVLGSGVAYQSAP